MARDARLKEFMIEVGERAMVFRLSNRTVNKFEAHLQSKSGQKQSFLNFVGDAGAWSNENLTLLLWCGLQFGENPMTIEELEDRIGMEEMFEFHRRLASLLVKCQRGAKEMIPDSELPGIEVDAKN